MLSSVRNADRAIGVNIDIIRAIVRLRRILDTYKDFREKLAELTEKYDEQFKIDFEAIAELMAAPEECPS